MAKSMTTIIVRLRKNVTPEEYAFVVELKNELNQRNRKKESFSFFVLGASSLVASMIED